MHTKNLARVSVRQEWNENILVLDGIVQGASEKEDISQKGYLFITILCSMRDHAGSAHPPASPCHRNWFLYDRVRRGGGQFWSVPGLISRGTEYSINLTFK